MSTLILPFMLRAQHVFLDARINGVPATLVLDSGSGMCALDAEWAHGLDLELGAKNGQAVGTDSTPISVARMRSLVLGDRVELRDEPVALVPLRDVSARHGRVVHGTIGFDFFKRYVVEVDFAARVLRLHDPATFAYDGPGERIPIDLSKRVPVLRAELVVDEMTVPVRLLLDLGTGGYASLLTRTFVDGQPGLVRPGRCTERLIGTGVGGSIHGLVTALDEIRLGNLRVPNPYVAIPTDSRGFFGVTWVDGTLGAPVLSRTRLILDYTHHEVILEPVAAMDAPFSIDQSGLSFRADGPDLDTVVIDDVAAGSPAAHAGIAVGDILKSVNGRAISGQSLEWVAEMFTQPGAIHSLRVEHEVPLTLQ